MGVQHPPCLHRERDQRRGPHAALRRHVGPGRHRPSRLRSGVMMRCSCCLSVLAWFLSGGSAMAVELATVDRSVHKEPVYQSKKPRYCLLVFGPQAQTRVWMVLDGDTLYLDRNGDGDLTEPGERVVSQQAR